MKVMHYRKSGYTRKLTKQELGTIYSSLNSTQSLSDLRKSWRVRRTKK